MHAIRVPRESARATDLAGRVLCHELRSDDGRVALAKGRVLDEADAQRVLELSWTELHLLALDPDDVHEDAAGDRIARIVAGTGVAVRPVTGGHWPLVAEHRGVLTIDTARLHRINELDGPCVYSLYDGQVVEAGETVGHAKIIPFAVSRRTLSHVDAILGDAPGIVHVRPFRAHRAVAVVHGSMGERSIARFRDAVAEKLGWFGSTLGALEITPSTVDAIAQAFAAATREGADVVLVAGTKAMDVLDPTFAALDRIGARMIRHGVAAHPGSLLWLAEWNGAPVVGMPTCGLFAKATVFDLVIARLMTGERLSRRELASLGHGGFLTRDMAFRLPAYRTAGERGAVE
jgi:hypothetical protein